MPRGKGSGDADAVCDALPDPEPLTPEKAKSAVPAPYGPSGSADRGPSCTTCSRTGAEVRVSAPGVSGRPEHSRSGGRLVAAALSAKLTAHLPGKPPDEPRALGTSTGRPANGSRSPHGGLRYVRALDHRGDEAPPPAVSTAQTPGRRADASRRGDGLGTGEERQGRAWVVLPPGMGKTLIGLEAARRLGETVVVLTPNTAIQSQWLREWRRFAPEGAGGAGADRALDTDVTVLTYQSLAVFDPDAETDEDGTQTTLADRQQHLHRLRPQGLDSSIRLAGAGPLTLVLGRVPSPPRRLGRLLRPRCSTRLPDAAVLGLTAHSARAAAAGGGRPRRQLFGHAGAGRVDPAAVRRDISPRTRSSLGDHSTPVEAELTRAEAERFAELTTDLLDPGFASRPFLGWLDERFVAREGPDGAQLPWSRLARDASRTGRRSPAVPPCGAARPARGGAATGGAPALPRPPRTGCGCSTTGSGTACGAAAPPTTPKSSKPSGRRCRPWAIS